MCVPPSATSSWLCICGSDGTRCECASRQSLDPRVMLVRTIPGVGPVTASAITATIGDARQFKNGRELATWLGLTPLNRSSGGKERLGRISKMGDRYLRR